MTAGGRTSPVWAAHVAPALGPVPSVGRRGIVVRVLILVCLLAVALLARSTGVLRGAAEETDPGLPPLAGAAQVLPGVLRGAAPSDVELVQLHDSHQVRAVVALGGAGIEEQAVIKDLEAQLLELDVGDGVPPTAEQVRELVRFVRATTDVPGQAVYVHDSDGSSPELTTVSAMLQVLDGAAASEVIERLDPADRRDLSGRQVTAVEAVGAAAAGAPAPDNPYAALREVAR